jgi:hypothetical protein
MAYEWAQLADEQDHATDLSEASEPASAPRKRVSAPSEQPAAQQQQIQPNDEKKQ